MKPIIMTLSGTRGIIGENFHPQIALQTGMAFGQFVKKGTVIVGGDTRTSHDMIKNAVISGLLSVGIDCVDIGRVPTPTVQQLIRHYKAQGGIVITASHNPVIWNGIKLMDSTGSFLDSMAYGEFSSLYEGQSYMISSWDRVGRLTQEPHALDIHIDRILSILDPEPIRKARLKALVDPNNGTGGIADPLLFKRLNVEYELLNEEPHGWFTHNPEPLEQNVSVLIQKMKAGNYDIGFAQDADADRLIIIDEKGRFIGEDYSLAFCVDYILSQEFASKKKVVVNLSTSSVLEWIGKKHHADIFYTKIGESYVTQEIKSQQAHVGGEGNGGVIFPKVGWGRDSLVGMTVALSYLAQSQKSVSQIVGNYPQLTMIREKMELSSQEEIPRILENVEKSFSHGKVNKMDGVKIVFSDSWAHVRPSNTEPIIRIFIEAPTREAANALMDQVKSVLVPRY